jgi:hypothetical protein
MPAHWLPQPETSAQLLARLVHHGGRVLVVGGGTENLPDVYTRHPQLVFWDDESQTHHHKEVPANVKAILWNRWISHSTVARLNDVVNRRRLLKFPMLRTAEIKELLKEIVYLQPTVSAAKEVRVVEQEHEVVERPAPKQRLGSLKDFVRQNYDRSRDYSQVGEKTKESDRLLPLVAAAGLTTTPASLAECVRMVIKESGAPLPRSSSTPKAPATVAKRVVRTRQTPSPKAAGSDDFEQLDKLIDDAITALKLVQEHMPRVRLETERLRDLKTKVIAMLQGGG